MREEKGVRKTISALMKILGRDRKERDRYKQIERVRERQKEKERDRE